MKATAVSIKWPIIFCLSANVKQLNFVSTNYSPTHAANNNYKTDVLFEKWIYHLLLLINMIWYVCKQIFMSNYLHLKGRSA